MGLTSLESVSHVLELLVSLVLAEQGYELLTFFLGQSLYEWAGLATLKSVSHVLKLLVYNMC